MGTFIFPPSSSSPIKSIQRGSTASAGNITISTVNTSKSFVRSFSNGSAGSVAGSGDETGTLSPSGGAVASLGSTYNNNAGGSFASYTGTRTFSGGTTNITSANYGVYLVNATTLTSTGACHWEVVEYN